MKLVYIYNVVPHYIQTLILILHNNSLILNYIHVVYFNQSGLCCFTKILSIKHSSIYPDNKFSLLELAHLQPKLLP